MDRASGEATSDAVNEASSGDEPSEPSSSGASTSDDGSPPEVVSTQLSRDTFVGLAPAGSAYAIASSNGSSAST